jgi:DNA polymerase alpha subunit B
MEYHHSATHQGGEPLEIMVACGPFTTSDNLSYEPLLDLLRKVITKKPDVLVLVGPFVDITQPLLANGEATIGDEDGRHDATYEMVFVECVVRDCIQALFNSEEEFGRILTNIVLIPSLLDGHHEFVFPQPPFGDRDKMQTSYFEDALGELKIPSSKSSDPLKRVHLLPNPAMFRYVIISYLK